MNRASADSASFDPDPCRDLGSASAAAPGCHRGCPSCPGPWARPSAADTSDRSPPAADNCASSAAAAAVRQVHSCFRPCTGQVADLAAAAAAAACASAAFAADLDRIGCCCRGAVVVVVVVVWEWACDLAAAAAESRVASLDWRSGGGGGDHPWAAAGCGGWGVRWDRTFAADPWG